MIWLIFEDLADAIDANNQIGLNMSLPWIGDNAATDQPNPNAQKTTQWAVPQLTLLGTYVFPSPDPSLLTGVLGYTEAAFDPTWFPQI